MHELVGQNLRREEITRLATEVIPSRSPFEKPVRQIDGAQGVTIVGMSHGDNHRPDFGVTLGVELRGLGKTPQRVEAVPAGALRNLSADVAGCDLVECGLDQIDLNRCPRARGGKGTPFRTQLACTWQEEQPVMLGRVVTRERSR